jgi:hypothetical protein
LPDCEWVKTITNISHCFQIILVCLLFKHTTKQISFEGNSLCFPIIGVLAHTALLFSFWYKEFTVWAADFETPVCNYFFMPNVQKKREKSAVHTIYFDKFSLERTFYLAVQSKKKADHCIQNCGQPVWIKCEKYRQSCFCLSDWF